MRMVLCATLLAAFGCIDVVDGSWFNGEPLDEYDLPNNDVPDELVEVVEMRGTQVEAEPEAPRIFGAWAHQCRDADRFDDCGTLRDNFKVIFFHGNAQHLDHYWDRVQILWRMGYPVFAVDYRGYGRSTGVSSEAGFYADGRTALEHALSRIDDDDFVIFYGFSIGSTVAIDLAAEFEPDALIVEAGVASGQAFGDDAIGAGFHQSVLMDTRFDNLGKIPDIGAPKWIIHGTDDTFIRFRFGELLFDAANDNKRFFSSAGAHSSVPCPSRNTNNFPQDEPCFATTEYKVALDDFVFDALIRQNLGDTNLDIPDDPNAQ